MKILNVVGARPNFMKMAPLMVEMEKHPDLHTILVHTGQHYDASMSDVFFTDLGIRKPDINLDVGSGTHAEQTALVMVRFEPVLLEHKPDVLVVVGDVNSTLACSLTAAKLHVPVAHVEAGIRSFDRSMPEEINRILTDVLSDYLFSPTEEASENLRREGIPDGKIYMVGNIMVDTLLEAIDRAVERQAWQRWNLKPHEYAVLTLHRPANVDDLAALNEIMASILAIAREIPVVFPIHPRTRKRIAEAGLGAAVQAQPGLILIEPLGYLDFLSLYSQSRLVLTDSGGIQTETTTLGIPCITLRTTTEYPITLRQGTNELVGADGQEIRNAAERVLRSAGRSPERPPLWDGKTAERIVRVLKGG